MDKNPKRVPAPDVQKPMTTAKRRRDASSASGDGYSANSHSEKPSLAGHETVMCDRVFAQSRGDGSASQAAHGTRRYLAHTHTQPTREAAKRRLSSRRRWRRDACLAIGRCARRHALPGKQRAGRRLRRRRRRRRHRRPASPVPWTTDTLPP